MQGNKEKHVHTYAGNISANIPLTKESDMTMPSIRVGGDYRVSGYRKAINWGQNAISLPVRSPLCETFRLRLLDQVCLRRGIKRPSNDCVLGLLWACTGLGTLPAFATILTIIL